MCNFVTMNTPALSATLTTSDVSVIYVLICIGEH